MPNIVVDSPYILIVQTNITLSGVVQIVAQKPLSGTIVTWSGSIYGTSQIQYSVTASDNSESGIWEIQSKVVLSGETDPRYGEIYYLDVFPRIV